MKEIPQGLLDEVIWPVLTRLDGVMDGRASSPAAINLLLGTAAVESALGEDLVQDGNGPARGLFQMEADTERWLLDGYLARRIVMRQAVTDLTVPLPDYELTGNLFYATALARVLYWTKPEPLPEADDVEGLAAYWKQHYNTPGGHGTVAKFCLDYRRMVV